MGKMKKLLVAAIVCIVGIVVAITGIQVHKHQQEEETLKYWKENALVSPKPGRLQGAGVINITVANLEDLYENSETYGKIKEYKVFVNDEQIATVKPEAFVKEVDNDQGFVSGMSLEELNEEKEPIDSATRATVSYHAVKTAGYEVYIEADYENGSKIYSDVFTIYISKKGLCVNKDMARSLDANKMKASWYYNWDMTAFNYDTFKDLEYIPMMWGYSSTEEQQVERLAKAGYQYILTYNEPDYKNQANIPVEKVVEAWPDFMNKGIRVSSPATALCPPWSKEWFQPFMKELEKDENLSIDFIALHHYWNWYADEGVDAFLKLIDESYEMYHKPIWITEFAIDGDPGRNQEQLDAVVGYMKGVLKGLEERDYVERYAWFSFGISDPRNGASSLYKKSTGEFTQLGELYASTGNPEGYGDKTVQVVKENKKKDVLKKK